MRLHDYLRQFERAKFRPGQVDCAQFVRGWVTARIGRDPATGYEYATLEEGQEALQRDGYADHVEFVAEHLTEVRTTHAQVGDIAVVESEHGSALGILTGEHVAMVGADGLMLTPRAAMLRAFTCR